MMIFVLKMMDFVFIMMSFVLKMSDPSAIFKRLASAFVSRAANQSLLI